MAVTKACSQPHSQNWEPELADPRARVATHNSLHPPEGESFSSQLFSKPVTGLSEEGKEFQLGAARSQGKRFFPRGAFVLF